MSKVFNVIAITILSILMIASLFFFTLAIKTNNYKEEVKKVVDEKVIVTLYETRIEKEINYLEQFADGTVIMKTKDGEIISTHRNNIEIIDKKE